jgi:hypothetical protein
MMYPSNWDKPKLDTDFVKTVKLFKKRNLMNYISAPRASKRSKRARRKKG